MARRPTTRQAELIRLIDRFTPDIRNAFLIAIQDLKSAVIIDDMITAIEEGDPMKAFQVLGFTPASMRPLTAMLETAFETGGVMVAGTLPPLRMPLGGRTVFRFDVRNSRAEAWLRDHSGSLVTRISTDQLAAIRNGISEGVAAGRNPRNIALDLVGRIDPVSGRRAGGVIGLTGQQERYVANARAELLSADPAVQSSYFDRQRRDARFDATVQKSIDTGTPIAPEDVNRIVGRYSDSLLQLRGETIGRTEALTSLNESQDEAMQQAIDTGAIKSSAVTRSWDATMDGRTRPDHREMNGQVRAMNEPFVAPDGSRMMFPGDFSLGADPSETINCRCRVKINIDFAANNGLLDA